MSGNQQLATLSHSLQKKISKAKPLIQQVESGELKTLTADQQRMVESYPKWIEDLEVVKRGEMPQKKESDTKGQKGRRPATPEVQEEEEQEEDVEEVTPHRNGRNGRGGGSHQKQTSPSGKPTAAQKHARMIDQIKTADKTTKKALIDTYINSKIDRSKLQALTKEYDSICQLRRDVLSGRVAKPTKMQNNRIALADQLKKEMALEQESMKLRADRERITFMCEIGEDDEEEEEEEYEEEYEEEEEEEAAAEEVPAEKEEEEVESEPSSEAEEPEETKVEEEEPATPKEAPLTPEAEDLSPLKSESETASDDAADDADVEEEPAAAAAPAEESSEEEPAKEEEEEVPPPPPPKPLDWTEITITKNRPRLGVLRPTSDSEPSPVSSPTTAAEPKVVPTEYTAVVLGVTKPTPKPAKKKDPAPAAKGGKGGKGAKAAAPASSLSSTTLVQNVLKRVHKDIQICRANPLPNVRFNIVDDNVLLWHVNVCPVDGPMAGCIVHLEMKFSELYPLEAPMVRCFSDIPHTAIGSMESIRNVLCMEHTVPVPAGEVTPTKGWTPLYTAFSVLAQLQNFFGAEAFSDAKKALGPSFKHRLLLAKGDISRFSCACGHNNVSPAPALPCSNGPLEMPPSSLIVKDGAMRVKGRSPVGHKWVHSYSSSGVYHFTASVISEGQDGCLIGVSSGRYNGPPEQIGKHPQSIALNTMTGATGNCGLVDEYEGPVEFPLPHHTSVLVTVDMNEQTVTFTIDDSVVATVSDVANCDQWHPSFALLSDNSALSAEFVMDESADWKYTPPAVAPSLDEEVVCFVSRATPADAILGVGLEVRRGKDFMPTSISSSMDVISKEACEKQKHSAWGRKFDVFFPLMLDADHSGRALKDLKRATSLLCRNPEAATAYEPPFRPANAVAAIAIAMQGAIDDYSKGNRKLSVKNAFSAYTRFLQCLIVLSNDSAAVMEKAQSSLDGSSSTSIFAVGSIMVNTPWPQLVKRALAAEFSAVKSKVGAQPSDDALFDAIKPKVKKFLLAAAFSHAASMTSLKKAQETFAATLGLPTQEMLDELTQQVDQIADVHSWDSLCTFLKVNLGASEL